MAKPATLQIKLLSTADTGFFYVTKKNVCKQVNCIINYEVFMHFNTNHNY